MPEPAGEQFLCKWLQINWQTMPGNLRAEYMQGEEDARLLQIMLDEQEVEEEKEQEPPAPPMKKRRRRRGRRRRCHQRDEDEVEVQRGDLWTWLEMIHEKNEAMEKYVLALLVESEELENRLKITLP